VTPSYEKALLPWHGLTPTPFSLVKDVKNPKPVYKSYKGKMATPPAQNQSASSAITDQQTYGGSLLEELMGDSDKEEMPPSDEEREDGDRSSDEEEEINHITEEELKKLKDDMARAAAKHRKEGTMNAAADETIPSIHEPVIAIFWKQTTENAIFPNKAAIWAALRFEHYVPENYIQALETKRNRVEISLHKLEDYPLALRNVLDTAGRIATMINRGEIIIRRTFDNQFCSVRISGFTPTMKKDDILRILFKTCKTPKISLVNIEKMNTDVSRDSIVVLTYNKVPYHFLELLLDEIEKKKATLIERRNKEGRIPTIMNAPYLRWGTLYLRFSINVPPMVYQERCPHCETVTGDTFMICHKEKLCPLPDISPSFRRVKERRRKSSEWKKPLDLDKLWSNSTISMNPVQPSATMDEANEDSRKKANKPNVDPEWSSQNFEDDEMDPDREKGSEPANKRAKRG
jgi:hypothetical protein